MTESRSVPLADVLSVTTDALLSRRRMDGVRDLLDWMTGDQLQMWQLPRAADAAAPALIAQMPYLEELQPPPDIPQADLYAWLVEQERIHGDEVSIAPLTSWPHQDPVEEFWDRVELTNLPTAER